MRIETMLNAYQRGCISAGLRYMQDHDYARFVKLMRAYYDGIARRYNALQAENARLLSELEDAKIDLDGLRQQYGISLVDR